MPSASPDTLRAVASSRTKRILIRLVMAAIVLVALWWTLLALINIRTSVLWFRSVHAGDVYGTILWSEILLFVVFGVITAAAVAGSLVWLVRHRPPFRPGPTAQPLAFALPAPREAVPGLDHPRRRDLPRRPDRHPRRTALADLPALAARAALGRAGPPLPPRHLLLRRRAAVPPAPRQPAELDPRHLPGRLADRLLPLRRDPDPRARPQAHAGVQVAAVAAGRAVAAGQGGRLLDQPLRADDLPAWAGHRHGLHRRARHPAGPHDPGGRRAAGRAAGAGQHLAQAAALPGARRRRRGGRLARLRPGLAGAGLPLPRAAERREPRPARDREQPGRHALGVRARRRDHDPGVRSRAPARSTTPASVERTAQVRLLDPNIVSPTYNVKQALQSFYQFKSTIDMGTYPLGTGSQDVGIAARELNLQGIPRGSWGNRHLVYTHGYGVVAAPTNQVDAAGHADLRQRWPASAERDPGRPAAHLLRPELPRLLDRRAAPRQHREGRVRPPEPGRRPTRRPHDVRRRGRDPDRLAADPAALRDPAPRPQHLLLRGRQQRVSAAHRAQPTQPRRPGRAVADARR